MHAGEERTALAADGCVDGVALCRRGEWAEAIDTLAPLLDRRDALGAVARHFTCRARLALGARAVEAGDLPAAEAHLRAAARVAGAVAAPPALAGLLARAGRAADCLEEMQRLPSAAADRPAFCRRLAQAAWQAGRREEAMQIVWRGLRRCGEPPGLMAQMGLFLAAEERYEEARSWLARAARADPACAEAHQYLGLCAAALGDAVAAVQPLQRALDLRGGDVVLAHQLSLAARAAAEAGQRVTIRLPAACGESVRGQADDDLCRVGAMLAEEPEVVRALCDVPPGPDDAELFAFLAAAAEVALEEHGDRAEVHLAASRAYARLGRRQLAIDRAREALRCGERCVPARVQLAELYAETAMPAAAADEIERAVADGADWPDVHYRAAQLHLAAGRADRARAHLRRALELNGRYAAAAEALAALAA